MSDAYFVPTIFDLSCSACPLTILLHLNPLFQAGFKRRDPAPTGSVLEDGNFDGADFVGRERSRKRNKEGLRKKENEEFLRPR